jgi:hypothetical protein
MVLVKHLRYLNYVLKHKWFVFVAGLKTSAPIWRLIIHDYTKFSRAEWTPYVNRFFGGRTGIEDKELDPQAFKQAWNHHWSHNPHHWEYWLVPPSGAHMMPDHFMREMVADWMGAGRAITGNWDELPSWYNSTKEKRVLHSRTLIEVENLLCNLGYQL